VNLDVVRAMSLVIAGNGAIAGSSLRGFWSERSVFTFAPECGFLDRDGRIIAPDPPAWMEQIRGAKGLWLHYVSGDAAELSERISAAFVGGGPRWIIEAVREAGSELWEAVDGYETPDGRTWATVYVRTASDWRDPLPRLNAPGDFIAAFDAVLEEIVRFAEAENEPNFARCFRDAQDALLGRQSFHRTFFAKLENYTPLSDEAKRILTALPPAWVFGGMGSWNDKGFEGATHERYEMLTNALYAKVIEGVVVAANSTFGVTPQSRQSWWRRLFNSQ
jgi:hypothetical protein